MPSLTILVLEFDIATCLPVCLILSQMSFWHEVAIRHIHGTLHPLRCSCSISLIHQPPISRAWCLVALTGNWILRTWGDTRHMPGIWDKRAIRVLINAISGTEMFLLASGSYEKQLALRINPSFMYGNLCKNEIGQWHHTEHLCVLQTMGTSIPLRDIICRRPNITATDECAVPRFVKYFPVHTLSYNFRGCYVALCSGLRLRYVWNGYLHFFCYLHIKKPTSYRQLLSHFL